MPLFIIREDICKISCDAIVNPSNEELIPGGGTDAAIHRAAGPALLAACHALGGLDVGEVKATAGFRLPAKHVLHTVGPVWDGGDKGEREALASCYQNALGLACSLDCQSIAFPLISAGTYGFPCEEALSIATGVISRFLEDHEMTVYLAVYNSEAYHVSERLFHDVMAYIDDRYVDEREAWASRAYSIEPRRRCAPLRARETEDYSLSCAEEGPCAAPDLDEMLRNMDKGFADTLFAFIDKKGMTDVECYKKANVDKKTFSKIKCNKDYRPSKTTAVSFAIALRLSLEETEQLLRTVGMRLSRSNKFDVIIEYFLVTGNYETIYDVNETLFRFDQILLGV
ncbi:MAG: macro domain-containing protein [Clostridia bacterium]|nr:macro domain-containing protein [Clostridia bacterium]